MRMGGGPLVGSSLVFAAAADQGAVVAVHCEFDQCPTGAQQLDLVDPALAATVIFCSPLMVLYARDSSVSAME
jgi:hypothetical protein